MSLRPFCNVCGWRKGGLDSWDGASCKCGHRSDPLPTPETDAIVARYGRGEESLVTNHTSLEQRAAEMEIKCKELVDALLELEEQVALNHETGKAALWTDTGAFRAVGRARLLLKKHGAIK